MRLDAGTVLLQWATGGLFFLWVTTRRREVGLGYGWLLRGVFLVLAAISAVIVAGETSGAGEVVRTVGAVGTSTAAAVALVVSVARRGAGVGGQRARRAARAEQVAAMAGRSAPAADAARRDVVGLARALLLRGDGRDGAPVPRHPDRFGYRPPRAGGAGALRPKPMRALLRARMAQYGDASVPYRPSARAIPGPWCAPAAIGPPTSAPVRAWS